jgi:hypothetical protein
MSYAAAVKLALRLDLVFSWTVSILHLELRIFMSLYLNFFAVP